MDAELDLLQGKVELLIEACKKLQIDNQSLRQDIAAMRSENDRLSRKINETVIRLENLFDQSAEKIHE